MENIEAEGEQVVASEWEGEGGGAVEVGGARAVEVEATGALDAGRVAQALFALR